MQMAHALNSLILDAWSLVLMETAYNVKVLIIYWQTDNAVLLDALSLMEEFAANAIQP